MRSRSGITLIEVGISLSIFSLFLLVFYALLSKSGSLWDRNSSAQDALLQLQRVRGALEVDLQQARVSQLNTARDGQVLWFLSAQDSQVGQLSREDDGSPFWSHNVVYYLSIPKNHDVLFGVKCSRPSYCAHKFLVRRKIRREELAESESKPTPLEKIFTESEIVDFLEQPEGYSLKFAQSGDDPPNVVNSKLIASGLLQFEVQVGVTEPWDNEIQVKIAAFQLEKAGQKIKMGKEALDESPFSKWLVFSVFPDH